MAFNEKLGYDEFRPPEEVRQRYYAAGVLPPDEEVAVREKSLAEGLRREPDYQPENGE